MDGEKDCAAFCTLYRVKLADSGIGMLCQVIFKTLEVASDPAGFINLELFGNMFPWAHAYSPWHVESSGSKKPAVYIGVQGPFGFHEFIGMVNGDMVQGLPFYEEWGHHIVELLQLQFRKSKPGTGFGSDLFVFLLSIGCPVKAFFQRAPGTLLAAIADVGRF